MKTRREQDTMGEMEVPADALYGAQTARAVANFTASDERIGREMIEALGLVKAAAAEVNAELGLLDDSLAEAIAAAAREVAAGSLDGHFPVSVFQTGSGTSSNMNANEVIANRAAMILGREAGTKAVHPNDHVNMGQSSNDVFPSAIHVAARRAVAERLLPALEELRQELKAKEEEFDGIVKTGRTHLQDAVPIRLGQEFSAFRSQVDHAVDAVISSCRHLEELAVGGTAVGTGLNTHPEFGRRVAEKLSSATGLSFREAPNHFEAQAAQDAAVAMSGSLKTLAVVLVKMANDIRWLGSGPRLGLGELEVPAVQPGSSIMPGKVNPVIAEALIMAAAQVVGNDAAITAGGLLGNFQLNTMLPLIARNLLEEVNLLAGSVAMFTEKLLRNLEVDEERIASLNERSLALATALVPRLGYDRAAAVAKEAHRSGRTVREVVLAEGLVPEDELDSLLDLRGQTERGG
jgi:fumarate hydratase class II